MILLLISFVFNDTATTEIYTYLHTLSLHDALPISRSATISPGATARSTPRKTSIVSSPWMKLRRRPATLRTSFIAQHLDRSEEHTSELQSLMRISYAVFCLKKKTSYTN